MATLILRLAGPLQAWGSEVKFEVRKTYMEPTKSGIIGLLSAALGRRRDESIDDLRQLRIGIRVDKEGHLLRDYHVVAPKKVSKKTGPIPFMMVPPLENDRGKAWITNRYYLSDAIFLVGIESSDTEFLSILESALKAPKFPLYLGRRACPPEFPLLLGIKDSPLLTALTEEPWSVSEWECTRWENRNNFPNKLRLIIETTPEDSDTYLQKNDPISFSPYRRQYGFVSLKELDFMTPKNKKFPHFEHDPMQELR